MVVQLRNKILTDKEVPNNKSVGDKYEVLNLDRQVTIVSCLFRNARNGSKSVKELPKEKK